MTKTPLKSVLWFCLGLLWAGMALADRPVTVFAAASLRSALDDIAARYTASGAGVVRVSYAGSSALARQIQNGAPAQIFLSANTAWMDVLDRDGLLVADTRRDLLSNQLVLIAPADTETAPDLGDADSLLAALDGARLAVALVDAVPAGIYAKEALIALGHWTALRPALAQTSNVRAALRLVALGEAPLGIVYATDAKAEKRVRVVQPLDPALHAPIRYPVALIHGQDTPEARAFYAHLIGPEARALFAAQGFVTVSGAP